MTARNTGTAGRLPALGKRRADEGIELSPKTVYRLAGGAVGFGVLLIVVAAFTFGRSKATVTGRVVYRGKPVIWGSVILVAPDGTATAGRIEPDGTYKVDGAAPGAVNVAVISKDPLLQHYATQIKIQRERVSMKKWEAPPVDRKKWFQLPKQYEDANTSGLSLTLTRGTNQFDIELP
jgi:hypothetical protein